MLRLFSNEASLFFAPLTSCHFTVHFSMNKMKNKRYHLQAARDKAEIENRVCELGSLYELCQACLKRYKKGQLLAEAQGFHSETPPDRLCQRSKCALICWFGVHALDSVCARMRTDLPPKTIIECAKLPDPVCVSSSPQGDVLAPKLLPSDNICESYSEELLFEFDEEDNGFI
jgi:hypothetical protein